MWRMLFLSIGIFMLLFGIQCLGVQQFTFKAREEPTANTSLIDSTPIPGAAKKFNPPPWAPWSLMVGGAVVCLYSFTLPKKFAGG